MFIDRRKQDGLRAFIDSVRRDAAEKGHALTAFDIVISDEHHVLRASCPACGCWIHAYYSDWAGNVSGTALKVLCESPV